VDIRTLINLRQVNQRFREVVTSLPLYKRLATHAIDALHACNRFSLSPKITLSTLDSSLTTTDVCHICGEFGLYLFMPTLQRCCGRCIGGSAIVNKIKVVRLTNAQRKAYAPYENEDFRIIRSAPEGYSQEASVCKRKILTRRLWLAAADRLPQINGFDPPNLNEDINRLMRYDYKYMCCVAVPPLEVDGAEVRVQQGLTCKGCRETLIKENARAIAAGMMPHCGSPAKGMATRQYSRKGYMEHFVWCRLAQEMWEAASGGFN
jgi:hypothetical protein